MKYGDSVKTWEVELDGESHSFRLEHNFWSGERKYFVDDQLLQHDSPGLLESAKFARDVPFNIGSHRGSFRYRAIHRTVFYDLFIDNKKIKGREENALRMPVWAIVLLILLLFLVAWMAMEL